MMQNKFLKILLYIVCVALVMYQCVGMYVSGIKPLFEIGYGLNIFNEFLSYDSEDFTVMVKLFAFSRILTTIIFLASFYYLLKIINQMFDEQYFEQNIDKNFRSAGKLIFISGLMFAVFSILLNITVYLSFKGFLGAPINAEFIRIFPIDSLPTAIITSFLGMLFMYIGRAFNFANRLKIENDLTI